MAPRGACARRLSSASCGAQMPYTLLAGDFVIRYPDLPRGGPEPDGDTVKFAPDSPALVERLRRLSGNTPDLNARGISVRLEAIDALETHFAETHQELAGANAARDELLSRLGFTGIVFFADQPNKVQSADQDRIRGHVLSNGIDANGRMIGFVYPGDAPEPDGATVFLRAAARRPVRQRAAPRRWPGVSGLLHTLPAQLRTRFAEQSRAARAAGAGIWPRVDGRSERRGRHRRPRRPGAAGAVAEAVPAPRPLPRLGLRRLRRASTPGCAPTRSTATTSFSCSTAPSPGTCTTSSAPSGDSLQLTVWPEDFIIRPDP